MSAPCPPHEIPVRLSRRARSSRRGDPPAATYSKPNFIVINVDDLGYGDIGPFGSRNSTPAPRSHGEGGPQAHQPLRAPVLVRPRAPRWMTGCYPKRVLPDPAHGSFPAAGGLKPGRTPRCPKSCRGRLRHGVHWQVHLGDNGVSAHSPGIRYYFGLPYSTTWADADGARATRPSRCPIPASSRPRGNGEDLGRGRPGSKAPISRPCRSWKTRSSSRASRQPSKADLTRRYTDKSRLRSFGQRPATVLSLSGAHPRCISRYIRRRSSPENPEWPHRRLDMELDGSVGEWSAPALTGLARKHAG